MRLSATLQRHKGRKLFDCSTIYRGRSCISIHATTPELLDRIADKLKFDWFDSDTCSIQGSAHYEGGVVRYYFINYHELNFFKADYKTAKKEAVKELRSLFKVEESKPL